MLIEGVEFMMDLVRTVYDHLINSLTSLNYSIALHYDCYASIRNVIPICLNAHSLLSHIITAATPTPPQPPTPRLHYYPNHSEARDDLQYM